MVRKPRLFLIGTSLLLLAGIRYAQAAEIKIVSPGAYEDIEGPNRSGIWPEAARAQGIAHRSDFDALPLGGAWLTEIRFRPDGNVPVGEVASFGRVQWSLSVTQVDPLDISFTFADNITGTPVEVYNAPWSSTVINPDPLGAETRPFDFRFPLETPYFYNPAEGNLLLDSIFEMPGSGVNGSARFDTDGSNAFSEKRNIWSGELGVDSPVSSPATFTSIHEFAFMLPASSTWNADASGNWSSIANWTAGDPNHAGAAAVFGDKITAPRTVTADVLITVGRIDFDNANAYTIAGSQLLTLDATSGEAQINVASGSHTITAPVTLADSTTITVTAAASNLSLTGSLNASDRNLTKVGDGTLTVNNLRAAGVSVNGGTVAIAPSGTSATTSIMRSLTVAGTTDNWTAKLDLANNDAVVQSSAANKPADLARLYNQVKQGFNNGVWTGTGITSTSAAANATADTGLAVVDNALLGFTTFSGQPVTADSILLKYTYYGDIDANGQVDADDLTVFASNFGRASGATQIDGDIDFNGAVNADDLTVFANNFNKGVGNPLAAATVAAIPEPATILMAGTASMLLLLIRRRVSLIGTCGGLLLSSSDSPLDAGCNASGQEPSRSFG